jgi:ribonucleotide monophosphatase NagD (HAD superfamily)
MMSLNTTMKIMASTTATRNTMFAKKWIAVARPLTSRCSTSFWNKRTQSTTTTTTSSSPSITDSPTKEFTMHETFSEIMSSYDAFIFDQYGVILDGAKALEGSIECIQQLHTHGRKLVILSNSCAPSNMALAKLPTYGFDSTVFVNAVTSGEESIKYILDKFGGGGDKDKTTPSSSPSSSTVPLPPKKVIWLTWDGAGDMPDPLPYLHRCGNIEPAMTVAEADFVLAHGCQVWWKSNTTKIPLIDFLHHGSLQSIEPILEEALQYNLPLLCANPDYTVVNPDGTIGYMPGNIGRRYTEMGGTVTNFGKPHVEHFDACLHELGIPRDRVAHVGDSLHHDIQGANDTGIASIFISSGIHAEALGVTSFGQMPSKHALQTLFEREGQTPTHVIPAVRF